MGRTLRQTVLYWHSIRHTRMSQLLARACLLVKRNVLVQAARLTPPRSCGGRRPMRGKARGGMLSAAPPQPLFTPRRSLVTEERDARVLCLLNRRFPLEIPFNWHDAGRENRSPLEQLTVHYMEYLEAVDDELFARLVEDWVVQNASYRPGYWLDCWNSYALSIRTVVWMQQYALRAARLPDHTRSALVASLLQQMRFLRHNLELDIRGNHLMKNIKALFWAGHFFTGKEANNWTRLGQRLLHQELREQILADGMHYERSPAYHCVVFADLLECLAVLEPGPSRDVLLESLARMAQTLADLTHPDGRISLFADGGLHMTYTPEECLGVYAALTGQQVRAAEQVQQ